MNKTQLDSFWILNDYYHIIFENGTHKIVCDNDCTRDVIYHGHCEKCLNVMRDIWRENAEIILNI